MIDIIDAALVEWAAKATNKAAPVSLSAPSAGGGQAISLYLLEIVDEPLRRSGSKPPVHPVLRYLVSTSAGDPQAAHRLLADLLYTAMGDPTYEIELAPVSNEIWAGFNLAPRPSFILRVPLPDEDKRRPGREPGKTVRQREPSMDSGVPAVPLYGILLGPEDIPLMNARIELPNLFRSAYTDTNGAFVLQGVPAAPKEKTLLIKARKREKTVKIQTTGTPDHPEIIRFNLFENEGEK